MADMHKIKEMLCDELDAIAEEGRLTRDILGDIDKITHSLKSIKTIEAMGDYHDESDVMSSLHKMLDESTGTRERQIIQRIIHEVEK